MKRKIPDLFCVISFILSQTASAQRTPVPRAKDTLPIHQWLVSVNPIGMLEPQSAFAAGIGYRIKWRYELWSETSLLYNPPWLKEYALGFRQILQFKYFVHVQDFSGKHDPGNSFFVAIETRFKYYAFHDTSIYNPTTNDTLSGYTFRSRRYLYGTAMQIGVRTSLGRNSKMRLELTAGVGYKYKYRRDDDIPAGYRFTPPPSAIDPKDYLIVAQQGPTVYFPGSVRLLYTFGKRLPVPLLPN